MSNDFTMHQFRLFLKVADSGSFSRAAIFFGLPQPSVSRIIARIEAIAGTRLFERSSRGVSLTMAGEVFREHAHKALHHHDLAYAQVRGSNLSLRGEARIATPESVANVLFFPLIRRFQNLHPQAKIRVITSANISIPSLLDNDVVDLGIIADTHTLPPLPQEKLCREDLYLIGPKDATELEKPTIPLQEVAPLPLLLYAMPGGFRSLIDNAFAKLKLKPTVKIEIDSNNPLMELILAGEGFSILPFSAIGGKSRFEQLAAAKIVNPEISRGFLLATAVNRPLSAVCREASRQVRIVMQEYAGEARWIWDN
ncbi:MAG: LysR family transcriptional regulator [Gammaproteobacteria bacterium]|nr:LysR family transcriptional regulator [Gammaproteobacteria bacterium]